MAFEKFTESTKSVKPRVSLRSNGVITFNAEAVVKFGLRNIKLVTLMYDKEQFLIGIKPVEQPEDGAHNIRKGRTHVYLSAKKFVEHFGIGKDKPQRLITHWDDKEQMIVAKIPQ